MSPTPHPSQPGEPLHHDLPLSQGDLSGRQDQAFLLGLQDPQGLSSLGHPQRQDPPETHQRSVPKGRGWRGGGSRSKVDGLRQRGGVEPLRPLG